jgi:hypothetical protein
LDEAEIRFRAALDLDSRNVAALRGLADVLLGRGEVEKALALLTTLVGEDPIDQDLPRQIRELEARARAPDGHDLLESDAEAPVWVDPDAVAEELNWDSASLQQDASALSDEGEEGPRGEDGGRFSAVEDGEPIPSPEDIEGALVTSTLGEIYLRQGLFDRAETVFETLLEADPGNERLKHRLEEARLLIDSQHVVGPDEPVVEPDPEELGTPRQVPSEVLAPAAEGDPLVPISAGDDTVDFEPFPAVVPIESLAPEWTDREPEEAVPIEALSPEEPISILDLVPEGRVSVAALSPEEAVPVDALAPEDVLPVDALAPEDVLSIDALAPEDVLPIDALAPENVLPIDALAPEDVLPVDALAPENVLSVDALAPENVLSINALAPGDAVSIDALAPKEALSIDSLAPDEAVPIDALEPDPPPEELNGDAPDGDETADDPTVNAFERWLENLE